MKFAEVVKAQLTQNRMSVSELARRMGYRAPYIHNLLKGKKRWNETTMTKAASVLGIEIIYRPTGTED